MPEVEAHSLRQEGKHPLAENYAFHKKDNAIISFCLFLLSAYFFSGSLYFALTEGEHCKKIYANNLGFLRCFPSGSASGGAPINS